MQKLFDGVYLLEGEIGGRLLQLVYLKGKSASLLFDTGCASDPQKFILPQIREAGGDPASLNWIVNSHPDIDHTGGNHNLKQVANQAFLACGSPDRVACASGENLILLRYDCYRDDHQIFYAEDARRWLEEEGSLFQPIDVSFVGGEFLYLSHDWEIEIISVPGHSKGHIALLDRKNEALYGGDALVGNVVMGLDSSPKLCPTYVEVDSYLNTIRFIEHLPISTYVGSHWPVKRGREITDFCTESRDFVLRVDHLLLDLLKDPQSLRDICLKLGPKLGDWPRDTDLELVYALSGHVTRFLQSGIIRSRVQQQDGRTLEYLLA